MSDKQEISFEEEYQLPEQDHEKGPGWFLIVSYVVIAAFCIYYLFTYWDWQSDYDIQQKEIRQEVTK